MTARATVVSTVYLLVSFTTPVDAQAGSRTLMHTFQDHSRVVAVGITDLPAGPQGTVVSEDSTREKGPFAVSKAQFESMWTTLMSSGMKQYTEKEVTLMTALVGYAGLYVFSVHMADGTKKHYAVPKGKASPGVAALAAQLRGYAGNTK